MRPLLVALLGLSCARSGEPSSAGAPDRAPSVALRYHLTGTVSVRTEGGALPEARLSLDLTLSEGEVRRFRDGSVGHMVVVEQAVIRDALAPPEISSIEVFRCHTFEYRAFDDGEVLAVGLADQVMGGGLGLDVLDPLLPLLSPGPPRLEEGEPTYGEVVWPMRAPPDRSWLNRVQALWTNEGLEPIEGRSAWRLRWSGPWTARGRDGRAPEPVLTQAEGSAGGVVWMDAEDRRPRRARFDGERRVRLTEGALSQRQEYALTLERIGPVAEPWPDYNSLSELSPLPRYLSEVAVREEVLSSLPAFQGCVSGGALTEAQGVLALEVGSDGRVSSSRLEDQGGLLAAQGCMSSAASALTFAAHDGPTVGVRWPVVVRAGQLAAHPGVELSKRDDVPMFFVVGPATDDAARAVLAERMGYRGASP